MKGGGPVVIICHVSVESMSMGGGRGGKVDGKGSVDGGQCEGPIIGVCKSDGR